MVPAHSVYWPIMLLALEFEMPIKFLVHGWWLVFGEKMPKSMGNFVAPVRYHLMREMTVGQVVTFPQKDLSHVITLIWPMISGISSIGC